MKTVIHGGAVMRLTLLAGVFCFGTLPAETLVWTGGANDGKWKTAGNWDPAQEPKDGDTLSFTGSAAITSENDCTDLTLAQIAFTGTGAKTVSGNAITLQGVDETPAWRQSGTGAVTCGCPIVLASGSQYVYTEYTNFWNGVVSGAGRLVKTGKWPNSNKDRLILTQSNAYTGGTELLYGYVEVRHEYALGQDTEKEVFVNAKTDDMNYSSKETAITIRVPNFRYPIHLSEAGTDRGTYQTSIVSHNINPQVDGVVFKNRIYGGFMAVHAMGGYGTSSTQGIGITGPTYDGPIEVTGMQFIGGTHTFNGTVTNRTSKIYGAYWGWGPTLVFNNAANDFNGTTFSMEQLSVSGKTAGALRRARFILAGDKVNLPNVKLNGTNQEIDRVGQFHATTTARTDDNTQTVTAGSSTRSVLTMKATGSDTTNVKFAGNLDLVWDPLDDYSFTALSTRASTMSGALTVNRGTFAISEAHAFPNVTKVTVGTNALFDVQTTQVGSALIKVTEVVIRSNGVFRIGADVASPLKTGNTVTFRLEKDAKIDLPTGFVFDPKAVYVDGESVEEGEYTTANAPWLAGGGTVYVPAVEVPQTSATWTGASGTDLRTAGNWKNATETPDLTTGGLTATFAESGTAADVTGTARFRGIVLSTAGDGFSFTRPDETARIRLGADGITCSDTAKYTFALPVQVDGVQTWNAGGATLALNGPLTAASHLKTTLTLKTTGSANVISVASTNTSDYLASVTVSGRVALRGADPLGPSRYEEYFADGLGAEETGVLTVAAGSQLHLYGVTNSKQVTISSNGGWDKRHLYAKSGTNAFTGWVRVEGNALFTTEGQNTSLTLAGGVRGGNDTLALMLDGPLTITNRPFVSTGANATISVRGSTYGKAFSIAAPSNRVALLRDDHTSTYGSSLGRLDLLVDDAFYGGYTQLYFGNKNTLNNVIDLNGHDQHFGSLVKLESRFRITSEKPATLYVKQDRDTLVGTSTFVNNGIGGDITGLVSLYKTGTVDLPITNAYTSAGALTVAEGRLVFRGVGAWTNGTSVAVDATSAAATLAMESRPALSRRTALTLTDGATTKAKVELGAGVRQRVKTCAVNGTLLGAGVWGSSQSDATFKDDDHFAGAGTLEVRGGGMVLILR